MQPVTMYEAKDGKQFRAEAQCLEYEQQRQKLVTQLEVIYIENHPDHRASGMSATALIYWGFRMGLLTEQEKNDAMGFARED